MLKYILYKHGGPEIQCMLKVAIIYRKWLCREVLKSKRQWPISYQEKKKGGLLENLPKMPSHGLPNKVLKDKTF